VDAVHDEAQAVGLISGDASTTKIALLIVTAAATAFWWWAMVNFPRAPTFTQLIKNKPA
jgi:hypothetical protein